MHESAMAFCQGGFFSNKGILKPCKCCVVAMFVFSWVHRFGAYKCRGMVENMRMLVGCVRWRDCVLDRCALTALDYIGDVKLCQPLFWALTSNRFFFSFFFLKIGRSS